MILFNAASLLFDLMSLVREWFLTILSQTFRLFRPLSKFVSILISKTAFGLALLKSKKVLI